MIKISNILKSIIASSTFILSTMLSSMQTGGGILPYVVEKTNGKCKVYFLLGREAHGKFKKTWADFGGRGKHGEKSYQVAAREGSEETMGILSQSYILSKTKSASRIGGTFIINIEDKVGKNPTKREREKFIRTLNCERKKLLAQKHGSYAKLEKDKFSWWRRKDLINAINKNSHNLRSSLINVYGQSHNLQTLKNIN